MPVKIPHREQPMEDLLKLEFMQDENNHDNGIIVSEGFKDQGRISTLKGKRDRPGAPEIAKDCQVDNVTLTKDNKDGEDKPYNVRINQQEYGDEYFLARLARDQGRDSTLKGNRDRPGNPTGRNQYSDNRNVYIVNIPTKLTKRQHKPRIFISPTCQG